MSLVYRHTSGEGHRKVRLHKVGVTDHDPDRRMKDQMRKYPNVRDWLAKSVSRSWDIGNGDDRQDRTRFDKELKANLAPYRYDPPRPERQKSRPTEIYRGKTRIIDGIIAETLSEHKRGRNW